MTLIIFCQNGSKYLPEKFNGDFLEGIVLATM